MVHQRNINNIKHSCPCYLPVCKDNKYNKQMTVWIIGPSKGGQSGLLYHEKISSLDDLTIREKTIWRIEPVGEQSVV